MQDPGEYGVSGVVIRLTGVETAGGAAVNRITQSDAAGTYLFPGLAAGQYTLTLDVPFAMRLATANQGADDAADSDFDPASAQAVVILAAPSDDDTTVDAGLWSTWQNPRNPLDVDDDGEVIPLDVLIVINDINAQQSRRLPIPPVPPFEPPPYLDVSGNGEIGPQDVLIVINYLNGASASAAGEGEGMVVSGQRSAISDSGRQGNGDKEVIKNSLARIPLPTFPSPHSLAPIPLPAPRTSTFVASFVAKQRSAVSDQRQRQGGAREWGQGNGMIK